MQKRFFILIILFFTVSCIQETAQINYREKDETTIRKQNNLLQPSYMRGSYVTTADNRVVRDLRKNEYETDRTEEYYDDEEIKEYEKQYTQEKKVRKKIGVVVVEKGDSLLGISRKYNMTLGEIAELNNKKPPYNIYVGQKIKVYTDGTENVAKKTMPVQKYKTIVVKSGDNLSKIAFENNSTSRELAEINKIKPPYKVYVGQSIKVPIKGTENNYHIVKDGDTLYSISKKNNMKLNDLIKINNLKRPYKIYIGQKLLLKPVKKVEQKQVNTTQKKKAKVVKNRVSINETETKSNTTVNKTGNIIDYNSDNEITQISNNSNLFTWPVSGEIIKRFGKQANGEFSDAINIKANIDTNIKAADAGEVAYAGNELKGYGNMIIIKHNNGWLSIYGHCNSIDVKVKDKVERGQIIAKVGKTGNVDEPQLYFAIRKGRVAMDPLKYLLSK